MLGDKGGVLKELTLLHLETLIRLLVLHSIAGVVAGASEVPQ